MRHSNLRRLSAVFDALAPVESDLGLPLLLTLLAIAKRPGLSINDLAELISVPQQTASRYVAILQGRYQSPGQIENAFVRNPLVSFEVSAEDPRRRALYLSARGEARVSEFLEKLDKKE
jgi:DNA-binding MarR family transcriptional regulator